MDHKAHWLSARDSFALFWNGHCFSRTSSPGRMEVRFSCLMYIVRHWKQAIARHSNLQSTKTQYIYCLHMNTFNALGGYHYLYYTQVKLLACLQGTEPPSEKPSKLSPAEATHAHISHNRVLSEPVTQPHAHIEQRRKNNMLHPFSCPPVLSKPKNTSSTTTQQTG